MLRAYFDESGHSQDPNQLAFSIGGCVSSVDSWEKFEEEWKQVLSAFNVTSYHGRFFSSFRGEYAEWTEDRRRRFLGSLIKIMDNYIIQYVGAVLPLSEYESLTDGQRRQCPDPYFMCFQDCVHAAGIEALHHDPIEKVECVFARHPEYSGKSFDCYFACKEGLPLPIRERLAGFTIGEPFQIVPLQAADMVAYELFKLGKLMQNPQKVPNNELRWPIQKMLKKDPPFHYYMDGELDRRIVP